MCDLRVLACR